MAITASSITNTDSPNVTQFPARDRQNTLPDNVYPISDTDHDNNNYNNRVRARAREMLKIHETYQDVLGRPMPRFVEQEVLGMIASGIEPAMIKDVLEYTACAPRPSWAYARTVILRNEEKGVTTALAFSQSLGYRGRAGDDRNPY